MEEVRQAVVIGRNYTSLLGMIRALGEAGCRVRVIRTISRIPSFYSPTRFTVERTSKYVSDYRFMKDREGAGIIDLLMQDYADGSRKQLLIPVDDLMAALVDDNRKKLSKYYLMPYTYKEFSVTELMDKIRQKKLADEAGLRTARGWKLHLENGAYTIPEEISYPVFVKPEISYEGSKRYMSKCSDEDRLKEHLKMVAAESKCPLQAEEFKVIEKEYGAVGYCDEKQVVIPALIEKTATGNGRHKGVTMLGRVVPFPEKSDLREALYMFIRSTGFAGLFDIDLYETDGEIYFNELNLRMGAFGYSVLCGGVNLPGLFKEHCEGLHDTDRETEIRRSPYICVSEKVALDDYAGRFMSWPEYSDCIKNADYRFIKNESDPGPWRAFYLEMTKQIIRRMLRMEKNKSG